MTDLKLHLFNMSFETRFLQGKKQDHYVRKNNMFLCLKIKNTIYSTANGQQISGFNFQKTE